MASFALMMTCLFFIIRRTSTLDSSLLTVDKVAKMVRYVLLLCIMGCVELTGMMKASTKTFR